MMIHFRSRVRMTTIVVVVLVMMPRKRKRRFMTTISIGILTPQLVGRRPWRPWVIAALIIIVVVVLAIMVIMKIATMRMIILLLAAATTIIIRIITVASERIMTRTIHIEITTMIHWHPRTTTLGMMIIIISNTIVNCAMIPTPFYPLPCGGTIINIRMIMMIWIVILYIHLPPGRMRHNPSMRKNTIITAVMWMMKVVLLEKWQERIHGDYNSNNEMKKYDFGNNNMNYYYHPTVYHHHHYYYHNHQRSTHCRRYRKIHSGWNPMWNIRRRVMNSIYHHRTTLCRSSIAPTF